VVSWQDQEIVTGDTAALPGLQVISNRPAGPYRIFQVAGAERRSDPT
jgi:hypothetical protein